MVTRSLVTLLAAVTLVGCASLPTNEELARMPEQDFRVWVRDEVRSCRVQQNVNTAIAVVGLGTGVVNMLATIRIAHALKAANTVGGAP